VSRELTGTLALQPLLYKILDQPQQVVAYTGAAIGILEGEELVIVDYAGPGDREVIVNTRLPITGESGYSRVARERSPVMINDAGTQPWLLEEQHQTVQEAESWSLTEADSWLGVPLLVKGELIGALRLVRCRASTAGPPGAFAP
jgi:GAF domain-containing protein